MKPFYRLIMPAWLLLFAGSAAADISLRGHLASDFVSRGIPQTDGEPIVGASLEWDLQSGWFVGASGYYAEEGPVPYLTRGWRGYGGWFHELGGGRALELSLSHYRFSGNFPRDWNYTEARFDWHWSRELAFTAAYSDDYYGQGPYSLHLGSTFKPRLGERSYLLASGGASRLGGQVDDWIWYGEAGVGLAVGRFDIRLMHHYIDSDSARFFRTDGRNTTSLHLDYLFR